MAETDFVPNLLRAIASELHYANLMQAARDKCGKSWSALDKAEATEVYQLVFGDVAALYKSVTPEFLSLLDSTGGPPFGTPPASKPQ